MEIQISESEKNLLEKEVLKNTLNRYIGVKSEDQIESEEYFDPRMILKALDSEYKESEKSPEGFHYKVKERIKKVMRAYNIQYKEEEEIEAEKSKAKIPQSDNPKCLLKIKKNEKFSRNEKCPATGKKYKHCCGAL